MIQKAILGLCLFGQYDHLRRSFTPHTCAGTAAVVTVRIPSWPCSVPPLPYLPIRAYIPPSHPFRSANSPIMALGWGEPFKENNRKIPRTIKRNMLQSACFSLQIEHLAKYWLDGHSVWSPPGPDLFLSFHLFFPKCLRDAWISVQSG